MKARQYVVFLLLFLDTFYKNIMIINIGKYYRICLLCDSFLTGVDTVNAPYWQDPISLLNGDGPSDKTMQFIYPSIFCKEVVAWPLTVVYRRVWIARAVFHQPCCFVVFQLLFKLLHSRVKKYLFQRLRSGNRERHLCV